MADTLKPVERLKKRLDTLKCPVVKDIDNDWMLEHLTKPCHQRLQILQWLFSKIDSKLGEMIETNKFTEEGKQIKDLLNISSALGFCSPDQIDFIKGTASAKDQVRFLSLVLDTVEICHEQNTDTLLLPNISNLELLTQAPDIECEYECQCQLIDDITRQSNIMENLFSTKVELLPADIKRQVDLNMPETGTQQKSRGSPLVILYRERAEQLRQDLESHETKLNDYKDQFEYHGVNKEQLELLCHQLEESLSELKEQIGIFNTCYENEMKLWCNKQPMVPTILGPVFDRAHKLLNNFESMMVTFDDIHISSDKIETLKTLEPTNPLRNTSEGFLLDFKELLNTLEVSVTNHRQDSLETDFIK